MSPGKLGSGLIWLTAQALGRQILLFFLFVILSRLLEPRDFGIIAIASATILLLQSLSSQAISAGVIQRSNISDEIVSAAFTMNLCFNSALTIITGFGCAVFSHFFPQDAQLALVIGILATTMPLSALYEVHQAILTRDCRFDLIAKKSIVGQVFGILVAVALAFSGYGVWSLITQYYLTIMTEMFVVWRFSAWHAKLNFDLKLFRELLKFGGPLTAARIVSTIDLRSPELILGIFAGQAMTGQFRIARALLDVVISLVGLPLRNMVLPILSPLKADIPKLSSQYLQLSSSAAWLFLAPFATLGFWAPELVVIIFGQKWADSGWIVRILSYQGLAYAFFNLYEPLLISLAQTMQVLKLRIIQTSLMIVSILVAIPFGGEGMIVAQTCGVLIAMPAMYYFVRSALNLTLMAFLKAHCAPAFAAISFILVLFLVSKAMGDSLLLLNMAASTTLAFFVYIAVFLVYGDLELRRHLLNIFRRDKNLGI